MTQIRDLTVIQISCVLHLGHFQVVEYWLRRPPGSVNTRPDFVGEDGARNRFVEDESARGRIQEHGYETLPETEGMVGYPPTHRYVI